MDNWTPEDERWLRDVETIKVFADTRRLELLKRMKEPNTVKAISAELGIPPSKLYYHVNLLHKHDLIRVVGHNIDSGIVEKIYQVTAKQFKLVNPLLNDAMPTESAAALFADMLSATQRDFIRTFHDRDTETAPPRYPFLSKKAVRLNDTQLTALHAKLDALIREVTAIGVENSAETQYELTLVFHKSPEENT